MERVNLTRRQLLRNGAAGLALAAVSTQTTIAGQAASQTATAPSQPASEPVHTTQPAAGKHQLWLQGLARSIHLHDRPPQDLEQWKARRRTLRDNLRMSLGLFPDRPCDLDPQLLGVVERDGYNIERLLLQTRLGLWATANAYVPTKRKEKVPGILAVHGHWQWARVDPNVQSRCLGLVKLGYFVLAIDAFGAGERGLDPSDTTYHGAILGAGLWPAGIPLLGMQVYDNMRAADYLQTRQEVDPERLGITGASGGGNQTMYAGAFDERFGAVVPVCSVGTFQSYLTGANCVCETLIGGLRYCEEGDVLAMVAPRALMVINATDDSLCFSVQEASKSVAWARAVFSLLQAEDRVRHVPIESKHAYNQAMREAMYGWMDRWLRDCGDGRPVPEPSIKTEELDTIRCFPQKTRPATFCLLPQYMHQQAQARVAAIAWPTAGSHWQQMAGGMRQKLRDEVLGGTGTRCPPAVERKPGPPLNGRSRELVSFDVESDMRIAAWWMPASGAPTKSPIILCLHPGGMAKTIEQLLVKRLSAKTCHLLIVELRGTGQTAAPDDALRDCSDHNSARWSIWLGRPLLGQWVCDILRAIDLAGQMMPTGAGPTTTVLGFREAGLAAILASALDSRIARVATCQSLASFVTDQPFRGQRMAAMVPNILTVGDIPHLAALTAPRPLIVAAPVNGQFKFLPLDKSEESFFAPTARIYNVLGAAPQFTITTEIDGEFLADALTS